MLLQNPSQSLIGKCLLDARTADLIAVSDVVMNEETLTVKGTASTGVEHFAKVTPENEIFFSVQ